MAGKTRKPGDGVGQLPPATGHAEGVFDIATDLGEYDDYEPTERIRSVSAEDVAEAVQPAPIQVDTRGEGRGTYDGDDGEAGEPNSLVEFIVDGEDLPEGEPNRVLDQRLSKLPRGVRAQEVAARRAEAPFSEWDDNETPNAVFASNQAEPALVEVKVELTNPGVDLSDSETQVRRAPWRVRADNIARGVGPVALAAAGGLMLYVVFSIFTGQRGPKTEPVAAPAPDPVGISADAPAVDKKTVSDVKAPQPDCIPVGDYWSQKLSGISAMSEGACTDVFRLRKGRAYIPTDAELQQCSEDPKTYGPEYLNIVWGRLLPKAKCTPVSKDDVFGGLTYGAGLVEPECQGEEFLPVCAPLK